MKWNALLGMAAVVLLAGCPAPGGSDAGAKPSCEAIVTSCHPVDPGTGPIHDCHEYAEAVGRTEAECASRLASCQTTCSAASDGGTDATTTDTGSNDSGSNDSGSTAHDH